jgi:hypothetical protein
MCLRLTYLDSLLQRPQHSSDNAREGPCEDCVSSWREQISRLQLPLGEYPTHWVRSQRSAAAMVSKCRRPGLFGVRLEGPMRHGSHSRRWRRRPRRDDGLEGVW